MDYIMWFMRAVMDSLDFYWTNHHWLCPAEDDAQWRSDAQPLSCVTDYNKDSGNYVAIMPSAYWTNAFLVGFCRAYCINVFRLFAEGGILRKFNLLGIFLYVKVHYSTCFICWPMHLWSNPVLWQRLKWQPDALSSHTHKLFLHTYMYTYVWGSTVC